MKATTRLTPVIPFKEALKVVEIRDRKVSGFSQGIILVMVK